MAGTELRYESGDLSAAQLKEELATFFESAGTDEGVRNDAAAAAVDLDALLSGGAGQIKVESEGPGITGFEEMLLVMLLTPPVQSAWSRVVLPWLGRRKAKPLGAEKKDGGKEPDGDDGKADADG